MNVFVKTSDITGQCTITWFCTFTGTSDRWLVRFVTTSWQTSVPHIIAVINSNPFKNCPMAQST